MDRPHLLIFGLGFTASVIAKRLRAQGWQISATSRGPDAVADMSTLGYAGHVFSSGASVSPELLRAVSQATHILVSIPPGDHGDPVLECFYGELRSSENLQWLGYLSTIGVYGDHGGNWIDETTPATPQSVRSKRRLTAEQDWQAFAKHTAAQLQIFRLAGIYGPGRSPLDRVRNGTRAIIKQGQVFNRTHVHDTASTVIAGLSGAGSHQIYNVCDDLPAPPEDVLDEAARLIGQPAPPRVCLHNAEISAMARSFYDENKRVRNHRIKQDLGVELAYPTYKVGLRALIDEPSG